MRRVVTTTRPLSSASSVVPLCTATVPLLTTSSYRFASAKSGSRRVPAAATPTARTRKRASRDDADDVTTTTTASSTTTVSRGSGPRVLLDDAAQRDGAEYDTSSTSFSIGTRVALSRSDSHHMLVVRRLRTDATIVVVAHGRSYQCTIVDVQPRVLLGANQRTKKATTADPWKQVIAEVTATIDSTETTNSNSSDATGGHDGEPFRVHITIVQGVARGDRLPQVIQHCTELGVVQFVPVITTRSLQVDGLSSTVPLSLATTASSSATTSVDADESDDNSSSSSGSRRASKLCVRWQRIAREATKQCRRTIVPTVHPITRWSDAMAAIAAAKFDMVLLPWEEVVSSATQSTLRTALASLTAKTTKPTKARASSKASSSSSATTATAASGPVRIAVLIGPEGGFTSDEVSLAMTTPDNGGCDARAITLGNRILRTETAALASTAAIMHAFDEL